MAQACRLQFKSSSLGFVERLQFIGIAKDGMSTDELMRMTRGDDWNQP
jgi:hypothetical protein